ncbi:MAG: YfhO family protein [Clostridia bacterium]|nr:YfhO family protein [Clostridia bacterium]
MEKIKSFFSTTFRRKSKLTEEALAIKEKNLENFWFYLVLFLLPTVVLELVYITFKVFPFGNDSLLVLDLNAQYIYYYEAFRDAILGDGSLMYNWSRALGGEFFGIFAYYTASPFMFVYLLFPKEYITEALLTTALLKTACASLTFGYFLNVTRGGQKAKIVIFSTMYALMSYFVMHQMNPMWLDAIIFLPLVMLGVDKLIREGKYVLYTIALTLTFISNFYIGFMVAIFTALYFFYSFFTNEKLELKSGVPEFFKKGLLFAAFSILSALIAAIVLIPTYFSLSLGKLDFSEPSFELTQKIDLVELLPKLLFGAYDTCRPEGLPTLFCGTLSLLTLPLFYVNKNIRVHKKIMATIICVILLLSMNMSTVDLFWHGLQAPNWLNYRYSFLFCAFLLIMGYEAFSKVENGYTPGSVGISLLGCLAVIFYVDTMELEWLDTRITVWGSIALVVIYFAFLAFDAYRKGKANRICMALMLGFVCAELYLNAFTNICLIDADVVFSSRVSYREVIDPYYAAAEWIRDRDDGFYRTEKTYTRCVNDNLALGTYGISHSSSTLNADAIAYIKKLGYSTGAHWTRYVSPILGTDSILGIKYIIQDTETNYGLRQIGTVGDLYVFENTHAMPICFPVSENHDDNALDAADYDNPFDYQNQLLSAMAGSDKVIEFYRPISHENVAVVFENVSEKAYGEGYTKYYMEDPSKNSHIEFIVSGCENMPLYAAFPSNYPRKVNIWINHEWYNTYLSSSSDDGIIPLGSYASDDQVSLIMSILGKDNDGTEEVFLKKKLFYVFDEELFEEYFSPIRNSVTNFEKVSDTKLTFTVEAVGGQELYTSIPYERGWIATVDGKEIETYRSENGMLGLELTAGTHDIVLRFCPDYFVLAAIISGSALVLFILIIVTHKILKKKGIKFSGIKNYLEIEDDRDDINFEAKEDIEDGSGNTVAIIGKMMETAPDSADPKAVYDEIFGSSEEKVKDESENEDNSPTETEE